MEDHRIPGTDEPNILAEQNRHLRDSLPSVLLITMLLGLVLVTTHWQLVSQPAQLTWVFAYLAISAGWFALFLSYGRVFRTPQVNRPWYAWHLLLTLFFGSLWGSSAWLFFPGDASDRLALMTFVVAGLGATAVVNLSARWQSAWMFLLPALLPFVLRFWMLDTALAQATALFIVAYLAGLMAMSLQLSRKAAGHIRAKLAWAEQTEASRRQHQRYQSLVESTTAIIWEGDPGTFAFRYVSPESKKLLGFAPEQWISDPDFWKRHIHPDDREWAVQFCSQAVREKKKHSFDYRMIGADGQAVWLRDIVNVVVRDGKAQQLVGVMIDISELKEIQRDLEYVSGLQRLMVDVSRDLFEVAENGLDTVLSATLRRIGSWCRADRAYLMWFTPDLSVRDTHEWVASGVAPQMHNLQNVPSTTIPMLLKELKRKKRVVISSVADLDDRWTAEKASFAELDIQSLIALPIFSGERLAGLIGFDSVRESRDWSDEEAALLQILGDLIGVAMERMDKERQLRASESLRTHAEALAGMGSWEWRPDSEEFRASAEWRKVTGCGNGPLTREQVLQLTPAEERQRILDALDTAVRTGESYRIEHRIVRPDNGEQRWIEVHAELTELADGRKSLRGFAQDITERKAAEEKLYHLAHYDSLTGMPNRVLVQDRLQQALKRAQRNGTRVAVLFLDMDQFKKVNDTLGHDAGDRMLVDVGARLQALFRSQDTVSRIGGDEFIIVLEEFEQLSDITASAARVVEAFHRPLLAGGREFVLTASIGIALSPYDGSTAHDLLRNADTAMYHAKRKGRDGYQFYARSMNDAVERQLALEEALRGALAREELFMHYQPLVRLSDRDCVGVEALLRWRHLKLGDVSPEEFVAVAEQSGLIEELGDFVLHTVVAQLVEWRAIAPKFCVSVNVSPRQFRDPGLAEKIISIMRAGGLDGDALEIEVTEGVLLLGRTEVEHTLRVLRQGGIGIVMDDFGTGYASLSYLRDHPFSSLKIDRSFIANLDIEHRHRKLVVSALQLGRALEMKVVAEGVETEQQLAVLIEAGCELVQGYLFGKPMAPDAITAILAEQTYSEVS